jgi:hypothetical protein
MTDFFCSLPQYIHAYAGIVPEINPRHLPSATYPINYSLALSACCVAV